MWGEIWKSRRVIAKKRLSCWLRIKTISRQREISAKYIYRTRDANLFGTEVNMKHERWWFQSGLWSRIPSNFGWLELESDLESDPEPQIMCGAGTEAIFSISLPFNFNWMHCSGVSFFNTCRAFGRFKCITHLQHAPTAYNATGWNIFEASCTSRGCGAGIKNI